MAAAVVTFVTAFVTAIALAVVDLYLTGHSRPSLMRPLMAAGTLLWRRGR